MSKLWLRCYKCARIRHPTVKKSLLFYYHFKNAQTKAKMPLKGHTTSIKSKKNITRDKCKHKQSCKIEIMMNSGNFYL